MTSTPTPSPLDEIESHTRQAGYGEAQAGIGSVHTHAFVSGISSLRSKQWDGFWDQVDTEIYSLGVAATNECASNAKLCK